MSRKKIVAGNWKMHKNLYEGKQLIADVLKSFDALPENTEVIFAPPFTQLELAAHQLKDNAGFKLAAQNCHQEKEGAYTGEVSASMLKSVDVEYVIIGHSERRQYFNENEQVLRQKVHAVLEEGLKVIFCVGELLDIRDAGQEREFVQRQLQSALFELTEAEMERIVIAYEPVWAIGTGRTASPEQAQDMHAHIRAAIAERYGDTLAGSCPVLYGGSCKPDNAAALFALPDVDGGLIGGASLKAEDFVAIINSL